MVTYTEHLTCCGVGYVLLREQINTYKSSTNQFSWKSVEPRCANSESEKKQSLFAPKTTGIASDRIRLKLAYTLQEYMTSRQHIHVIKYRIVICQIKPTGALMIALKKT